MRVSVDVIQHLLGPLSSCFVPHDVCSFQFLYTPGGFSPHADIYVSFAVGYESALYASDLFTSCAYHSTCGCVDSEAVDSVEELFVGGGGR